MKVTALAIAGEANPTTVTIAAAIEYFILKLVTAERVTAVLGGEEVTGDGHRMLWFETF